MTTPMQNDPDRHAVDALAAKLSKFHRDVLAALPDDTSSTPAAVHRRLCCWSLISVRHALRELWQVGAVQFRGENGKRRYGRTPLGRAALVALGQEQSHG